MRIGNIKDSLWIIVVSVLILFWASLPTWAGYQAETDELRFRGIHYDSQDYAAHIAMMEAGRHGELTYQFRFTTESFEPTYNRVFYLVLGHLGRWLNLDSESVFHFARWILGFVALFALYQLTKQIFQDIFWARVAFLLAALGSGLGWLQVIFNLTSSPITPIDFWLIDSYVFFSLSVFPHFAFVTAAMCITLRLWLNYLETWNRTNIIRIVLLVLLVQLVNPIAFAAIDAGFVGAAIFSWRRTRQSLRTYFFALAVLGVAQIPLFLYNLMVLNYGPLWTQYTRQHQTLSPSPDYYLWGFALFWPFVIFGAMNSFREKHPHLGAAIFWTVAAFSLAYAPLYTQQRFLQNITIPLAILATYGFIALFEAGTIQNVQRSRWKRSIIIFLVFLASLSSIQLSLGRTLYLQTHPKNFYYPANLDHAVEWLRQHAQYNDFVLAAEGTSQVVAQKAGVRVYSGHEMETLYYKTKRLRVRAFFRGNLPELATKPIQWIVYGPLERELSPTFSIPSNLELVYDVQGIQIYQVK